jgi:hypothetical protein
MKLHSRHYCMCALYVRVYTFIHVTSRCNVHLENPLRVQLAVSHIRVYRLHSLMRTDNFVWCCVLRTAIILLNHCINAIRRASSDAVPVSRYAACQSGRHICGFASRTRRAQSRTVPAHRSPQTGFIRRQTPIGGTFLAVMNWLIFTLFISLWHCLFTLGYIHAFGLETSSGRTMNCHTEARKSFTEWMQFSSYH